MMKNVVFGTVRGQFFFGGYMDKLSLEKSFEHKRRSGIKAAVVLIILLLFLIVVSSNLGKANLGFMDVIKIIIGNIFHQETLYEGIKGAYVSIVWDIRLPRILTAVIVGAGLAASGAVFQSLLMNPLADSYTMGISTGAAFGASIAIFLNLFVLSFQIPVILFSFIGALLTLVLVMSIANVKGYLNSSNMIIAGIIVSSILSAGISFIKSISGEGVSAIVNWLMGNLASRSWNHVQLGFLVVVFSLIVCMYYAEDLNLMSVGEKEARNLGVDVQRTRIMLMVFGSMITAACVSIAGIISFIGLIVPHMLRFLIGSDNRKIIPLSALMGGLLLLSADTLIRFALDVEIPVGILTTLLGGPFFIYIFVKKNRTLF
jgi:iron complex transport system permease protein